MKRTAAELIEHCKKALKNNVQYIYGAKMEVLSYNQIKAFQSMYGSNMVWVSDIKKAGKLCCDCSGLISSCTGVLRGSANYKQTAEKVVSIAEVKKNWQKYIGWAFWLSGHIGVVSDKEGYYYAMDGSARNMVHYPISKQKWVYALKLCDIDYTAKSDAATKVVKETEGKEMIVKKNIDMFGKIREVDAIVKDDCNYIKMQDLNSCGELAVTYNQNTKVPALNLSFEKLSILANGESKTLNKAVNINGTNFVSLRELIDNLSGTVKYNADTKLIEINV